MGSSPEDKGETITSISSRSNSSEGGGLYAALAEVNEGVQSAEIPLYFANGVLATP